MTIKKYIITASPSLRIREKPSTHSSTRILGTLPRGAEFYSDMQEAPPNGEEWARKVDEYGRPTGWLQIRTVSARHLQELPLPTPPAFLPDPALPPVPVSPDLAGRVAELERRVGLLETR